MSIMETYRNQNILATFLHKHQVCLKYLGMNLPLKVPGNTRKIWITFSIDRRMPRLQVFEFITKVIRCDSVPTRRMQFS